MDVGVQYLTFKIACATFPDYLLIYKHSTDNNVFFLIWYLSY